MSAQPAIPSDPQAVKVVNDAVAALGGEKFLNVQDRVEIGRAYSFYHEKLSGLSIAKIYTRYITIDPNKTGHDLGVRERQSFGKSEDTAVVLTENGGADVNWIAGKPLAEADFERYRDSTLRNIFYLLRFRLHEKGMVFESRGADVVEHQPVDIVDISDAQNRTVTVMFHQSTKLPVKQMFSWRDPVTHERSDEVTYFARYRETDGINWPMEITRERNGDRIFQLFADSVRFNQDLTDDLFSLTTPTRRK